MRRLPLLCLLGVLLVGCPASDDDDSAPTGDDDDDSTEAPRFGPEVIGGARPAAVVVPDGYDGVTSAPLMVLLHGYGANADLQDFYFQLSGQVDASGFFLVKPDGTEDASGSSFWNARPDSTEAVDDVAYLMGLVDEMIASWRIDEDRVYFLGHSNGGFMSYRLACEHGERLAGIVSLAGLSPYADEADCQPSSPVSVLHVHGTDDSQVLFAPPAPRLGAVALAARWAERAGCDLAAAQAGPSLDLVNGIAGDETTVLDYEAGCDDGRSVSLWTIEDGGHLPLFNDTWAPGVVAWLLARAR